LAASSTTSSTASTPPASTKKDAEVDYFKNLRGLNESLRSAVNEFIDNDPFVDLRKVFDQYQDYRVKVQEDFDSKVSPPSLSSTTAPAPSVSVVNKTPTQAPPSRGLSSNEVKAPTSTDTKPLATSSSGSVFDTQSKANKSDGSSSSLPFSPVSDPVHTISSRPAATTSAFSGFGTNQLEPSKGFTPASQTPALSVFGTKQTETFKDSTPASRTAAPSVFGTHQNETFKGSTPISTTSTFSNFAKQHETPKGFTPVPQAPALLVFGTKQHETTKDSTSASQTAAPSVFGTHQNETFKGYTPVSTTSTFAGFAKQHETPKGFTPVPQAPPLSIFGTKQHETFKAPTPASTPAFSGFGTKQNETLKGFTPASATTALSNFGTKQHETSKGFTPASQAPALSVFGTKQHETSKDSSPASKISAFPSFGTKQYENSKDFTPAATASTFSSFGTKQHETSKDSSPATTTSAFSVFGAKQYETLKNFSPASSTPNLPPKQTDSKTSPSVPLALSGPTNPETKPTSIFSPRTFGSGFSSNFNVTAPTQPEGSSVSASGSRFTEFSGFGSFSQSATTPAASLAFKPSSMTPMTSFSPSFAQTPSTLTTTASDFSTNGGIGAAVKPSDAKEASGVAFRTTTTAESFIIDADNKHDREGAGEEDEETVYSAKLKAYVMKDGETGKSWVELGYGVLRVKKHKESQAKRVLLRSSSTGQILIVIGFFLDIHLFQRG